MLENNSHRLMFAAIAIVVSGAVFGTVHAAYPDVTNKLIDRIQTFTQIDPNEEKADFQFSYNNETKTASIYGIANPDIIKYGSLTIPSTTKHNGETYTINAIGSSAFSDIKLTSVKIPDTITSIGTWAFKNDGLLSVNIPDSVTEISDGTFANNNISNVILGDKITKIGAYAFQNNDISNISIPEGTEQILIGAFDNNKLTNLYLPNSVKEVGNFTFSENKLTNGTVSINKNTVYNTGDDGNASFGQIWDDNLSKVVGLKPTLR